LTQSYIKSIKIPTLSLSAMAQRPWVLLLLAVPALLLFSPRGTAAASGQALLQPQLRILAVPLLPTSPTMDMMAVLAELKARCVSCKRQACMHTFDRVQQPTL
jgi:hypothetical protein